MPGSRLKTRKGKRRTRLKIWKIVAMALALSLALFFAMDAFTTYWFMLFNQDGTVEERRREDFHWYDSNTGTQGGGRPSNGNASPGYEDKYTGNSLESALNAVTASLDLETLKQSETAYRFFIYLMDRQGYQPNAIIGAMSYIKAEGGSRGTFTYESYKYCTGPSGKSPDYTLDNEAWLTWLNNSGFEQAKVLYANMRKNGKPVAYAAIGLGLTQESDVWDKTETKTSSNATNLINFAISKGGYWQYPNIQMLYLEQKFQSKSAWDINQNGGVDPKTSSEVTATEWACRVLCGIGMPSWDSSVCSTNHPAEYKSHVSGVDKAAELYYQYSGKDPWFYSDTGALLYPNSEYNMDNGTNDWHDPFHGPSYGNSDDAGLLIARMALLLAGDKKITRMTVDNNTSTNAGYYAEELVNETSLQYYREAQFASGNHSDIFASCDEAASLAILLAGIDTGIMRTTASHQHAYMSGWVISGGQWRRSDVGTGHWEYVGLAKNVQLRPGDVIFEQDYFQKVSQPPTTSSDIFDSSGMYGAKHIMIWVGENVAGERWPGTDVNLYEASRGPVGGKYSYYPKMRRASSSSVADIGDFHVFRYKASGAEWSSKYWDKFMNYIGAKFPELPREYPYSPKD